MLIKTKLHLPTIASKSVKRPDIVKRFSLEGRFTTLIAPAGYGKTNVVLEWINTLSASIGWVSLDEGDNDLDQFMHYLLAACENADTEFVKLHEQVRDVTSSLSLEHILTILVNIFVSLSKPYILILDDFHHIENPEIHDAISFVLKNKPPNLHIVFTSRTELPFPIGLWRANNEVTELRAADLRMSQDEIAAFFIAQNLPDLSEKDIQALDKRTEGWTAALQLAAIAMQGNEDAATFISDFAGSHIYVVDYLTDEVMQQQPEDIQRFLVQTSLLPRISASLCNEILDIEDSQHFLEELEAQNLFLIKLDDQREWYRYHHLFQDMLRYRLQRETPEQIAILHRRASRWFIQHGWIEEGISHAIDSGDWRTLVQIINQNATAMFSQGKMNTVRRWFSNIPDNVINESAEACINYAWAFNLTGASDEMTPYLRQAEKLLGKAPQPEGLEGQLYILRGYQARRRNEFGQSIQYLEQALTLLPQNEHVLRATSHVHLGIAQQLQNELARSLQHYEQAQQLAGHLYPYTFTAAIGLQAGTYVEMGRLQKAEQLGESTLKEKDANPGYGYVMMVLGAIMLETNRLEESETILEETIELGYLSGDYSFCIHSLIRLAQLYQQKRQLTDASTCLDQAQRLMLETQSHFGTCHYDSTQLQQWILEKNTSAVQQWLDKHLSDELSIDYQLIFAKGLIATEQFHKGIRLLEGIHLPVDNIELRIQRQCLLAVAYRQARDEQRSDQAIAAALTLAEPNGFQRVFCVFNPMMLQIFTDILTNYKKTNAFSVAYIGKLIKLMEASMQGQQALDEPLTEREMTVLRMMAAGLTNRAIAEELVISIGTVKGYSHNIYSKLAVSNRQDAVQSAYDLNLI